MLPITDDQSHSSSGVLVKAVAELSADVESVTILTAGSRTTKDRGFVVIRDCASPIVTVNGAIVNKNMMFRAEVDGQAAVLIAITDAVTTADSVHGWLEIHAACAADGTAQPISRSIQQYFQHRAMEAVAASQDSGECGVNTRCDFVPHPHHSVSSAGTGPSVASSGVFIGIGIACAASVLVFAVGAAACCKSRAPKDPRPQLDNQAQADVRAGIKAGHVVKVTLDDEQASVEAVPAVPAQVDRKPARKVDKGIVTPNIDVNTVNLLVLGCTVSADNNLHAVRRNNFPRIGHGHAPGPAQSESDHHHHVQVEAATIPVTTATGKQSLHSALASMNASVAKMASSTDKESKTGMGHGDGDEHPPRRKKHKKRVKKVKRSTTNAVDSADVIVTAVAPTDAV